jgi:UDP-N-acetylglucosamine diphosphorylase/glucosamine-1-phosphate N-acetyltransferase
MHKANSNNALAIIILAAGKGKRMLNQELPKVLSKVNDKPLIAYVIDSALKLNPQKIVIVVGFLKNLVVEFVKKYANYQFDFVEQVEQLGTGHAVAQTELLLKDFSGDILILCGDVPFLKHHTLSKFINNFRLENSDVSVLTTFTDEPKGYGRIIRNHKGDFTNIIEEKDANDEQKKVNEINSGVFIVKAKFLYPSLKKISNSNAQGEYYLTDIIEILLKEKQKVNAFPVAQFQELLGINSPKELELAENFIKLGLNKE